MRSRRAAMRASRSSACDGSPSAAFIPDGGWQASALNTYVVSGDGSAQPWNTLGGLAMRAALEGEVGEEKTLRASFGADGFRVRKPRRMDGAIAARLP